MISSGLSDMLHVSRILDLERLRKIGIVFARSLWSDVKKIREFIGYYNKLVGESTRTDIASAISQCHEKYFLGEPQSISTAE